jgi:hypothetical protein
MWVFSSPFEESTFVGPLQASLGWTDMARGPSLKHSYEPRSSKQILAA